MFVVPSPRYPPERGLAVKKLYIMTKDDLRLKLQELEQEYHFRGLFFLYLLTVIALIPYFVGNHVYGDCLMYIANYDLGSDGDIQQALYIFGFDHHDVLSEPTFCEFYKVGLITIF